MKKVGYTRIVQYRYGNTHGDINRGFEFFIISPSARCEGDEASYQLLCSLSRSRSLGQCWKLVIYGEDKEVEGDYTI